MLRVGGTHPPSGDDAEVHRRLHFFVPFVLVDDHTAEGLDTLRGDGNLGAAESVLNTNKWEAFVVAEPEAPVESAGYDHLRLHG